MLPVVAHSPSFLPFSIVANASPDAEQPLADPDRPASEDMDIFDCATAAIGADTVDPIRPYADLKAINGSNPPAEDPETGGGDPDMTHLASPRPHAEKAQINHAVPAGQAPLPHADKTALQGGALAPPTAIQTPPDKSVVSPQDMMPRDGDETALSPPISKAATKGANAAAATALVTPNLEDVKIDQNSLLHGFHRLRETEFIGAPIVPEKVLHQIANALSHFAVKTDGDTVELLLTPKELGACRFKMVVIGDRVDVDLAVDNPDVLQLMRRQVDLLITELKSAGFNHASINFSKMKNGDAGSSRSQHQDQADQMTFDPESEPEISLMATPRPLLGTGRLHLKL